MDIQRAYLPKKILFFIELAIVVLSFALMNIFSFTGRIQHPDVSYNLSSAWMYTPVILLTTILILIIIWQKKLLVRFASILINNKALLAFIIFAHISLLWSVYFGASIFKLIYLVFTSAIAAYFVARYEMSELISLFAWIGAVSVVLSYIIIVFFPSHGRIYNRIFEGAWRGMFWHRNHMGSIMAFFSVVFLLNGFNNHLKLKWINAGMHTFLYFGAAILVFGSRSATGIFVFLLLSGVFFLSAAWVRWGKNLKRKDYWMGAVLAMLILYIAIANLEFIFGLLGRNLTMTGRLPLWEDLLFNFVGERPFFGHGYGAFWMVEETRLLMMERQGWPLPIWFADNGYIDILLGLGVVGLVIFLVNLTLGFIRGTRYVSRKRTTLSFFSLITLLYVFVANISYSFLLEVDQFVWMLFLIALFSPNDNLPEMSEKMK